jgi:hypothetical protein
VLGKYEKSRILIARQLFSMVLLWRQYGYTEFINVKSVSRRKVGKHRFSFWTPQLRWLVPTQFPIIFDHIRYRWSKFVKIFHTNFRIPIFWNARIRFFFKWYLLILIIRKGYCKPLVSVHVYSSLQFVFQQLYRQQTGFTALTSIVKSSAYKIKGLRSLLCKLQITSRGPKWSREIDRKISSH